MKDHQAGDHLWFSFSGALFGALPAVLQLPAVVCATSHKVAQDQAEGLAVSTECMCGWGGGGLRMMHQLIRFGS